MLLYKPHSQECLKLSFFSEGTFVNARRTNIIAVLTGAIIGTISIISLFDKAAFQTRIVKAATVWAIYELEFKFTGIDNDGCSCCDGSSVCCGLWGDSDWRWRNSLCARESISCDDLSDGRWRCIEGCRDCDGDLLNLLARVYGFARGTHAVGAGSVSVITLVAEISTTTLVETNMLVVTVLATGKMTKLVFACLEKLEMVNGGCFQNFIHRILS
jgi:hypothetical protein